KRGGLGREPPRLASVSPRMAASRLVLHVTVRWDDVVIACARLERGEAILGDGPGAIAALPESTLPARFAVATFDGGVVRVNAPEGARLERGDRVEHGPTSIALRDGESATVRAGAFAIEVSATPPERIHVPAAGALGGARVHMAIVALVHGALLFCG